MIKYYLFRLLRAIDRLIPRRAAYLLGRVVSGVFCFLPSRTKANLRRNLKQVLSFQGRDASNRRTRKEINRLIRVNFRHFAYYLIDFFRFANLPPGQIPTMVEVTGREHIDRALTRGRGLIGVTAHVGNWELGGIVFSRLGYPINAIALSHQNTKLNRLFVHQRGLGGVKVIPVGHAAASSLRALRANEVVVLLSDRDVTEKGTQAEFFGRPAAIPRGPAVLAVHSGAAILFGYFVRHSFHRYQIIFRPLLEWDRSLPEKEQEEEIIRMLVKEMERCILRHLDQWYMFYQIW